MPKSSGGFRVINHLSYPRGESINSFINDEDAKVTYSKFDDALCILADYSPNAKMAKVDVKSAYRLLPIGEKDFIFLGLHIGDKLFIKKWHWPVLGNGKPLVLID